MTDKEFFDKVIEDLKLKPSLGNEKYYFTQAQINDVEKIIDIQKRLKILLAVERLFADEFAYIDENFGNNKVSSMCIDGVFPYKDEEEQELIQNWIKKVRGELIYEYNNK